VRYHGIDCGRLTWRISDSDFSERDRERLELLRRHLAFLYRQ